ncbi:prepilin-type N-terminal cleavage/methylation domain-containing protein [Patescibacteria group bacterium]|nr:prepilin-type N-terminal cleavage/methylation domain-containing protein [Patescibacteria group bacterium]
MRKMKKLSKGFTMIELLIVIAVLGVLAVAVLSAINPIEQINRGKDTGSRSDTEQLVSAIERYYASMGYYPWRPSPTGGDSDAQAWLRLIAYTTWKEQDSNVDVLSKLDGTLVGTTTGEVKNSFTTRISSSGYNFLWVYNGGAAGGSTYVCFRGLSAQFQLEAKNRCTGTVGSIPTDLVEVNVCGNGDQGITVDGKTGQYLTCLP